MQEISLLLLPSQSTAMFSSPTDNTTVRIKLRLTAKTTSTEPAAENCSVNYAKQQHNVYLLEITSVLLILLCKN